MSVTRLGSHMYVVRQVVLIQSTCGFTYLFVMLDFLTSRVGQAITLEPAIGSHVQLQIDDNLFDNVPFTADLLPTFKFIIVCASKNIIPVHEL